MNNLRTEAGGNDIFKHLHGVSGHNPSGSGFGPHQHAKEAHMVFAHAVAQQKKSSSLGSGVMQRTSGMVQGKRTFGDDLTMQMGSHQ